MIFRTFLGFIVIFSTLFSYMAAPVNAQLNELQVELIENAGGPIPVFRDNPDLAAIHIRSSLENLTFESNLQIAEQLGDPAAGEYILLIEPMRQVIRVNAPGFIQARIQTGNLQQKQTIYYSVEPISPDTEDGIPVVIRITPEQAQVQVNGDFVDVSRSVPLAEGLHVVEARFEGFRNLKKEIEVSREQNFFELTMEEISPEPVRIRTNPPGATVFIEGVDLGQTDRNGILEFYRFPGVYDVSVSLSGYLSQSGNLEIIENTVNEVEFNLERNAGMLSLSIAPNDATVTLNRESYDPSDIIYLLPGTYRLEIMRDGFETHSENVVIERDQLIEKEIELNMLFGRFYYSSSPASATARLRNSTGQVVQTWSGLRRFENLPVDDYVLTVSDSGFQSHQENIRIENNQTVDRRIVLLDAKSQEATVTSESDCPPNLTDIDGNQYDVIQIGTQCWMGENLRSTHYQNEDRIEQAETYQQWQNSKVGAYTFYNKDNELVNTYGYLYNWAAVSDGRNICPAEWSIPSDDDWKTLEEFLGLRQSEIEKFDERGPSNNVGGKLKARNSELWTSPNAGATDEYAFSGLPGGLRFTSGPFANMGNYGYWWSSTELSENRAIRRSLSASNQGIFRIESNKNDGYSVRCILK